MLLFACTKKEDSTTDTAQKPLVKTISTDSGVMGTFWYDNQGRITCSRTADPDIDSTVYNYGNNSLEKKKYLNGILQEIEHGILENGNIVSINGIKADSSSFWSTHYTYDGNGFLIREIHMDNDTVETWRVEYQVLNGNVISMNRSNYFPLICSYEYYPGTINSLVSIDVIDRILFNKSKNLVKIILMNNSPGPSIEEDYTYEYFDNGWVKKLTSTVNTQSANTYFTYW